MPLEFQELDEDERDRLAEEAAQDQNRKDTIAALEREYVQLTNTPDSPDEDENSRRNSRIAEIEEIHNRLTQTRKES